MSLSKSGYENDLVMTNQNIKQPTTFATLVLKNKFSFIFGLTNFEKFVYTKIGIMFENNFQK